jgi:hypothetical protein
MTEPIQLRPESGRGVELCHTCGQSLPETSEYLTPRELDVLTAWWLTGSVKEAARVAGVGEQRAKNLLAAARIRNGAATNARLLAMHFAEVRQAALRRVSHNVAGR